MKYNIDADIKQRLLDSDDVVVPEVVTKGIDEILSKLSYKEVNHIENTSNIHPKSKSISRKFTRAAVVLLAISCAAAYSISSKGSSGVVGSTVSQIISLVSGKSEKKSENPIEDFTNFKGSEAAQYKNVFGESVTDNGVTIRLDEVIFDMEQMIITYSVTQNKADFSDIGNPLVRLYINNSEFKGGFSGSHIDVDKNTRRFILILDKIKPDIPKGELNIKLSFGKHYLYPELTKFLEGKWEFSFVTNREELMKNVRVVSVNKVIKMKNNDSVNVDKIIFTPISTTLKFSGKSPNEIADLVPYFNIYYEDGTKLMATGSHKSQNGLDDGKIEGYCRFQNLNSNSGKIKIEPYCDKYDKNHSYNKELAKQAFEIEIK